MAADLEPEAEPGSGASPDDRWDAGLIGLSWLAFILRLDAIISPFGTGLIYQTSGSRVSYGLGRNRYFPPILTRTDSRGSP